MTDFYIYEVLILSKMSSYCKKHNISFKDIAFVFSLSEHFDVVDFLYYLESKRINIGYAIADCETSFVCKRKDEKEIDENSKEYFDFKIFDKISKDKLLNHLLACSCSDKYLIFENEIDIYV